MKNPDKIVQEQLAIVKEHNQRLEPAGNKAVRGVLDARPGNAPRDSSLPLRAVIMVC
jgi:hypothetical protein